MITFLQALLGLSFLVTASAAWAADFPPPKEGEWIAREFKFHTGEIFSELKLHYTVVGESTGIPVVILHGTSQSAASMLTPTFGGELFGAGQPLDATKYYIAIPDWDTGRVQSPQTV